MSTSITFQSRKDALFIGVMVFAISACLFPIGSLLYKNPLDSEGLIALSILIATTLLLASFFTHTYYVVDQEQIKWRSGPLNGTVNIADVKEIVVGTSVYVGMRPATARKECLFVSAWHRRKHETDQPYPQNFSMKFILVRATMSFSLRQY